MPNNPFPGLANYQLPHDTAETLKGGPQCDTWIVVNQEESSNSELMELLSKILQAVKLDFDMDVHVLMTGPHTSFYLYRMFQDPNPSTIISFGSSAKHLGFNMKTILYERIEIDKVRYLFSHDLNTISNEANMKKMLWSALKSVF